jgi:methylglyoxal synthase
LYDIPLAHNRATADFLLTSRFMKEEYARRVLDYNAVIKNRLGQFMKEP